MLKKLKNNALVFFSIFLVTSCGGSKKIMRKYFGVWDVITAYDSNYESAKATIEFRGESNVFGFGGCNTYAGTYSLNEENRTLSFGPLMATKKYCQGVGSTCESNWFRALNNTKYFLPKEEGIYLQNSQKKTLAFIRKR